MPQFLQEAFSARQYLETYYPSSFNEKKFFTALLFIQKSMSQGGVLEVGSLSKKIGLPSEIVENAAILNFLREVSERLLRAYPNGRATLLDIGGGPTLYQHIPLCLNVSSIIHGEFLSENRAEVLAYLDGVAGAYPWEQYFTLVKKMLSKDSVYQELLASKEYTEVGDHCEFVKNIRNILEAPKSKLFEAHLKKVLARNVVTCDVFSPTLEPSGMNNLTHLLGRYTKEGLPDIISAHFLVESATDNFEKWQQGLTHLLQYIPKGGYFLMTAIRHASWYLVGDKKIGAVSVDEESIKKFLEEHSIVIECMQVLIGSDQEHHGYDGMVFILGKKL